MGIWVGRYAIVDGAVQEHGPWLVERRRTRDDASVRLVVLAEPADARSAAFCAEVAAAVAELFARESLSVTGGILRALQQAHENLAEWNRRSLREHRVAVGVTCVAVRGMEATIAQVGPGVVYIGSPGGVQRLVAEGEPAHPLGGHEPIEPQFHRAEMRAQSVLLLSRAGEAAAGPVGVSEALRLGPDRALADLFMRTRSATDMVAALVAEIDGVEDTELELFDAPLGSPPASPGQRTGPPAASGTAASLAASTAERAGVGAAWSSASAEPEGVSVLGLEQPPAPVDSGAAGDAGRATGRSGPRSPLPELRRPRIGGGDRDAAIESWRPWAIGAFLLTVVIALLWWTIPALLDEDREAQLADAINAAVAQITVAEQSIDANEQRTQAEAALTEIARARSVDPTDPRIAALAARAQGVLDGLDAIHELSDPRVVLPFDGVITAPFDPANLIFGGGSLWLLDGASGRVLGVDPTGGGTSAASEAGDSVTEVYRAGEVYDGAAAREPIGITWDAVAQRLLVLDAARTLFEVAQTIDGPTTPTIVPLRAAADLRSIVDITAYDSNLYLLDPEGGDVWRYLPAGGGFDSERSGLLGRAVFTDARRLYVDGDVFVLEGQTLRRFTRGAEAEAMLSGIDRAIQGAAGIVGETESSLLYIADRGNRRVVVTTRDGVFQRQYVHPELFDLRGLALSPGGDFLYVLTAEAIVEFPLTPIAAPTTPAPDANAADADAADADTADADTTDETP